MQERSIDPKVKVLTVLLLEFSWMDPIIKFLAEDHLPNEGKEVDKVRKIANRFWLSKDQRLYRRSFGGPYLLCLHPSKVNELLTELHGGIYGSHIRDQSLTHRAITQGFWWPNIQKDAAEYVKKCDQCQKHAPLIHQPA